MIAPADYLYTMMDAANGVLVQAVSVTKASGQVVPFDKSKLVRSLEKSGADSAAISHVMAEVNAHLFEGITTKQIYRMAFAILKKKTAASAARYQLKAAIADLGPTGYPFERLVGALFEHQDYDVKVGELLQGHCVQHEVDVIAQKDNVRHMMECKFHSDTNRKCDVKVALYIRSRFVDVEQRWLHNEPHLQCQGWLVTNARFTGDAIQYGSCVGLNLLSWDYPHQGSLKERIDTSGLHPVTCLTTLKKSEKQLLLTDGIVLCRDLQVRPDALNGIGLTHARMDRVMHEVRELCQ